MSQFSVYARFCNGKDSFESHLKKSKGAYRKRETCMCSPSQTASMKRSSGFRVSAVIPHGKILTNWHCFEIFTRDCTSQSGRLRVTTQYVTHTFGLAVQKSQANRNSVDVEKLRDAGLAVQKSQANRNSGHQPCLLRPGLAVQKSQANRNECCCIIGSHEGLAVQRSQANRNFAGSGGVMRAG